MKIKFNLYILALIILILPISTQAAYYNNWNNNIEPSGPPEIIFPVEGGATFTDDFGDGRSGGRTHEANDLLAPKMTRILAAQGGIITFMPIPEPSYGYMLSIAGDDGYKYNYIHINNDTPGTDDNNGGPENAYAPGISVGTRVSQGQPIAWVGDSGNAEDVTSHLHFEIRLPNDTAIDPYPYLVAALNTNNYDIEALKAASPDISVDKSLVININTNCQVGDLLKTALSSTVYYCGSDGKRYVFPNAQTYFTWYDSFDNIKTIDLDTISQLPLAGNVTYRPGIRLLKLKSDTRVYAVAKNGTLRLLTSPSVADKYYGSDWNKQIDDIPDSFFTNYTIGKSINN